MNVHTLGRALLTAAALALVAPVLGAEPVLVVRHTHHFLVVSPASVVPAITLASRSFHTYADALSAEVLDADSVPRLTLSLPLGETWRGPVPGPGSPLYLVVVRPGMNGVAFAADRPWGVVAGDAGLGSNGPVPELFLYVPEDCARFTLTCSATSPNEGARVVLTAPDGATALVLDGEFDRPDSREVAVPAPARGKVWSFTWAKPQSVPAGLDDVVLTLDGRLAPLLWPDRTWAKVHGPTVWSRHRAAMGWR